VRAWRAADLAADRSWHLYWEQAELAVLIDWAQSIEPAALVADPTRIRDIVPGAPEVLRNRADEIRGELIDGRGLFVLSGLSVDDHDQDTIAVAFLLFGSLIGSLRTQNAAGHLLGHVTDVGADVQDPTTRIYQTNHRQTFHTDSTDAVGLLCLCTASTW